MKAKAEPNLDLIKVLIEARNQKLQSKLTIGYTPKAISIKKININPWKGFYSNHILDTIWIYLN